MSNRGKWCFHVQDDLVSRVRNVVSLVSKGLNRSDDCRRFMQKQRWGLLAARSGSSEHFIPKFLRAAAPREGAIIMARRRRQRQ